MPSPKDLSLGSWERTRVGVIVTARELQTGERLVLHEEGTTTEGMRAVIARLDKLPGDWRVLCLCTPVTIFRDLQGTRLVEGKRDALVIPEREALSRIGRIDRLDPSLLPADTSTRKRFRDTWQGVWKEDPDKRVSEMHSDSHHRPLGYLRDYRRARRAGE